MGIQLYLRIIALLALECCEQISFANSARTQYLWAWRGAGIGFHLTGAFFWYWLISVVPLGIAVPLHAGSYMLVAIAARLVWAERLSVNKIAGIGAIIAGLILMCRDLSWV